MMSDTASEVSLSESLLALDTMTTADVDFGQTDAQDHQTMDSDLETLLYLHEDAMDTEIDTDSEPVIQLNNSVDVMEIFSVPRVVPVCVQQCGLTGGPSLDKVNGFDFLVRAACDKAMGV